MRERVRPGAAVLALALVLGWSACSRTNPAFLIVGDGGMPGPDAQVSDGGEPVGDAALADGPCQPGAACQAPGEPCLLGTLACEAGGPVCGALQKAPNGSACGAGKICKDGSCTACPAGDSCAIGDNECVRGTITCLDPAHPYTPFCANPHPAPDGTPCAGGVCHGGRCGTASTCSAAAADCADGEVCDLGSCAGTVVGACVVRPAACADLVAPVCGCDRNTYANDCERLRAGVALDHAGSCAAAPEADCMDGVDNDGNGTTDCQDPACTAGYACVDAPLPGWVTVAWVDPEAQLGCDGLTPVDLYDPADIVPATIGCGCLCTPAAACVATLECYPLLTCDDPAQRTPTLVGACHAVPAPSATGACRATALEAKGSCGANQQMSKPTPSYTWAPAARACTASAGGYCESTGGTQPPRCVPRPPAGTVGPCLAQTGSKLCPAPYTVGSTFATGHATDNRTCAGCSCGGLQGAECQCPSAGGTRCGIEVGASATCDLLETLFLPVDTSACVLSVTGIISAYAKLVGAGLTSSGSCQPTQNGNVTGSITAAGAITVCCLPPPP